MSFDLNAVTGGSVGGTVETNTNLTLAYVGIGVVFLLGLTGSLLPPLIASYFPNYNILTKIYFKFFSGFAAGIVIAVGFVHSIGNAYVAEFQGITPNYFDSSSVGYLDGSGSNATFVPLGSSAGPGAYSLTQDYNWSGFIAMIGVLITFSVEELILSKFGGHSHGEPIDLPQRTSTVQIDSYINGDSEKQVLNSDEETLKLENVKLLTDMWTLWLGLSFHSVFVGLALGFSPDYSLFSAIVAHQFFEGVGLGARVARARIQKRWQIWIVDFAYAIMAPLGTSIGVGVYYSVDPASPLFQVCNMTINGLAAGILIYVSIVHMIKGEMDRDDTRRNWRSRAALYVGILLGACAMSIIGIWA